MQGRNFNPACSPTLNNDLGRGRITVRVEAALPRRPLVGPGANPTRSSGCSTQGHSSIIGTTPTPRSQPLGATHLGSCTSHERPDIRNPRGPLRFRVATTGNPLAMSDGLTYEQAAAILGCHFSNVAKLIRKGDLTSTGKRGASLSREQVEALAERRLPSERPGPPGHPASTSALTFAPTRPRVAVAAAGRRAPGRHAASGPGPHPPRHAASGRERRSVLGAAGSPGAGGGGAVGAEDAAAVTAESEPKWCWR